MRFVPALLVLMLTSALGHAQPYAFQPQRWYPLQVGNAWHQEASDVEGFNPFTTHYVALLDRDTMAAGHRWFHVQYPYVAFNGPYSQAPHLRWLAWSSDAYLLALPRRSGTGPLDFSRPDTLDKTWPRSAFTVNVPQDTTLYADGFGRNWRAVTYIQGPPGAPVVDSTTFRLNVNMHPWYTNTYRYGVGPHRTGGAFTLGALVNGVAYGDVSRIRQALATEPSPPVPARLRVQVHQGARTMTVQAGVRGWIRVFDLLGRERLRTAAASPTTLDVNGLPAGLYVVHTEAGAATIVLR